MDLQDVGELGGPSLLPEVSTVGNKVDDLLVREAREGECSESGNLPQHHAVGPERTKNKRRSYYNAAEGELSRQLRIVHRTSSLHKQ